MLRHHVVSGASRDARVFWRSAAAGQSLEEEALTLAVVAYVRHRHTRYDQLLMSGHDRGAARAFIREDVDRVLETWRNPC